jgi:hypothetical protein
MTPNHVGGVMINKIEKGKMIKGIVDLFLIDWKSDVIISYIEVGGLILVRNKFKTCLKTFQS